MESCKQKTLEHFTDSDSECLTDSALGEFYLSNMPVLSADEDQHAFQRRMDEYYMGIALKQARQAEKLDEVPIGAVVVREGEIVALGYNRREIDNDPAGHAEFIALKSASEALGVWRLSGCTVYVTLEPCLMCAGLMYQSRIDRCVYGASDPKAGALGSLYSVNSDERLNHCFEVTSGVLEEECAEVLQSFFRKKRQRNKERKRQARLDVDGYDKEAK